MEYEEEANMWLADGHGTGFERALIGALLAIARGLPDAGAGTYTCRDH